MVMQKNKLSGLPKRLIKYRVFILLLIVLPVLAAAPGMARLNITVSMDEFFLDDDPVIRNQEEFNKLFGNNDFIGVLVEGDNVFSRECLELIHRTGEKLQKEVPFAAGITSIGAEGTFLSGRYSLKFSNGALASSDEDIEKIKNRYLDSPSVAGRLVSKDSTQAWILLSLENYPVADDRQGDPDPQFTAGEEAWKCVQSIESGNYRLTATGVPVYAFRKKVEMMDDLTRILVVGFITALVVLTMIIRNFQGIIGSLSVIIMSVLAVFGTQGLVGTHIDSSFIAVPLLLSTGVSIGYTVHISRFFILRYKAGFSRKESVIHALEQSGKPVFFTAFTTIAALLSFELVELRPIKWVGMTSALCILAVYILSVTVFPIILSFGRGYYRKKVIPDKAGPDTKNDWLDPLLARFADITGKYPKSILVIFTTLFCIAVLGLTLVKVDFNAEKMMGTRLPHMQDQMRVGSSDIASSDTLDLVLKFKPDALKDPKLLENIAELEKAIIKLPLVTNSSSLNSIISGFNYLSHGYDPAFDMLPEKPAQLRGLLTYFKRLAPEQLHSWVSDDYSSTRIFIELSSFSSNEIESCIARITEFSSKLLPPGTEIYFSGSTYQMALMNQYVTRGLVKSILGSLIMIAVLMIILFRDFRTGIIAMIPNIFPVMTAGAAMGFTGIPLEFVTMTIAPMIMGLAVDDTIHLIFHLKKDMNGAESFHAAVAGTFRQVGSAITETTIIICLTFLVFTFSRINSIIYMGIISCLGMLTAYFSDIFLTPVLMKILLYKK